jgi:hypothetical protein
MCRLSEHLPGAALLNDVGVLHDEDIPAEFSGQVQVVGDGQQDAAAVEVQLQQSCQLGPGALVQAL